MIYEREGYDTRHWPDSYWRAARPDRSEYPPLAGAVRADVAIIGAGYAGLNAALELVESSGADVVLLEAADPGWGASGRNGGFCCRGGSMLSDSAIRARFGPEVAQDWADFETAAIARVRDTLARARIEAEVTEPGELLLAHSAASWQKMQAAPVPEGARLLDRATLAAEGLASGCYHGGLLSPDGFGLQPYAYVRGLAQAATQAGVRIFGQSRAIALRPEAGGWQVATAGGIVQARQVLIATNGYSDEALLPWLSRRILPVISNIMVTRPLTAAELDAQGWARGIMAYDDRRLLHYFRLLPDQRLMFGARGGLSFQPQSVTAFAQRARRDFELVFPGLASAETEFQWNGLVCLTGSLAPFIGPVPGATGLWLALGWHGNGVAASSEGGRRAAQTMMGRPDARPLLARRPPPRFFLPRKLALRSAMALADWLDGPLRRA